MERGTRGYKLSYDTAPMAVLNQELTNYARRRWEKMKTL